MSTRSTNIFSRPAAFHAPDEHGNSGNTFLRPASRLPLRSTDPSSETDVLLRRSHALVEKLRRAVEARQNIL